LEVRTAFLPAEPGARREAAVALGAQPAAVVVAAAPDAQLEAAAVVEPDAQPEAVVAPDARQEAAAGPDAQLAAAEPDAQQAVEVAAVSYAQQAAVVTPGAVAMKSRVRSLVASVEPAETAAVRLWFRATMVSAAALEPALVSAAKVQAAADR